MRVRRDLHVRETRPLPRSLRASEDVARSPPPTPRYDGRSFTGCTEYDWSKPWCGTTGCGICDNVGVSGGCWDECAQDGQVRAKVESELRARSGVCYLVFEDGHESYYSMDVEAGVVREMLLGGKLARKQKFRVQQTGEASPPAAKPLPPSPTPSAAP